MRDFLHIGGLFVVFSFLVTRFPSLVPEVHRQDVPRRSFASFVTLSPADNAARLETARTSWQVRNRARGRPSIGRLDADIPLLSQTLPPPTVDEFNPMSMVSAFLPEPDPETYSFIPPTMGAAMPEFSIPPQSVHQTERSRENEMLSIDDYETLKEYMK